MKLPKGQYDLGSMPRFGLPEFSDRFPAETNIATLKISGEVENRLTLTRQIANLPRVEQTSDFHCVTTWSCTGLNWQGVRFRDLYEQLIIPLARPNPQATWAIFKSQDGFRSRMLLKDLLADSVLIADRLNGKPLTIANGAPHRLIVPDHYGYKNAKHVNAIEFHPPGKGYKPPGLRLLEHARGRVEREERGTGLPGWLLRYLYRPLVRSTIKTFADRLEQHLGENP